MMTVNTVMVNSGVHCGPSGVDPNCLCLSFFFSSLFISWQTSSCLSFLLFFTVPPKRRFLPLTFFFPSSHRHHHLLLFPLPPLSPLQVSFPLRASSPSGSGAGSLPGGLQLHRGPQVLCTQPLRCHLWPAGAVCPWGWPPRHQRHRLNFPQCDVRPSFCFHPSTVDSCLDSVQ